MDGDVIPRHYTAIRLHGLPSYFLNGSTTISNIDADNNVMNANVA
jgi:hypothetical protein|tara:strand:+ start:2517 stop:2651 length:135 start_codon:yes stop_codon:yes gene_type:complete